MFLIFILQDNNMFYSMWCDLNWIQICVGRIKTFNFHMWSLKGDDMKRFQHGINYHPKNDTPSLKLFKLMHGYLKKNQQKIFYLKNMPKTNVLRCKIFETNIYIIMCCDIICHRLKHGMLIKNLGLRLCISTT